MDTGFWFNFSKKQTVFFLSRQIQLTHAALFKMKSRAAAVHSLLSEICSQTAGAVTADTIRVLFSQISNEWQLMKDD